MTELKRVEELRAFYDLRGASFCGQQARGHVLELCDIARKALEERDGLEQLAQERARNVTQLQDLRHELSEKCVRLQRRLDDAVGIMFDMSLEDKQNG